MGHEGDFADSLLPHHFQEKLKPPCEQQNMFGMLEINKGRMEGCEGPAQAGMWSWDVELGCEALSNSGKTSNRVWKKNSFLLLCH